MLRKDGLDVAGVRGHGVDPATEAAMGVDGGDPFLEEPALGSVLIGVLALGFQYQYGTRRHCQVDEKLVDQPPRYWAPARREPAMLGIKNGRQPQLDNTVTRVIAVVR